MAVSVLVPAVVEVRLQLPEPATSENEQFTLPSLTVTELVGIVLLALVTLTATAYAWPTVDGSGVSDVIVTVGVALLIVCVLVLVAVLKVRFKMPIPAFGHVGDGNIHVNFMVDGADPEAVRRAQEAEGELFRGVVALEGVISGEHGIGFTKAKYLNLGLSDDTIALMKRVKYAFDPHGILNPGKIFPE